MSQSNQKRRMIYEEDIWLIAFGFLLGMLGQIAHGMYLDSIHPFLSSLITPSFSFLVEAVPVMIFSYLVAKKIRKARAD